MQNLQIDLDWRNNEYLTSISGYFGHFHGSTVIQSLIFQSTRRTYGPYGTNKGLKSQYFSLPSNFGKIVGFHGRSHVYLHSIGAYVKPYCKEIYPFKSVGLFGGLDDGDPWGLNDGEYTDIRHIDVVLGNDDSVIAISFEYEKDGYMIRSPAHGSHREGSRSDKVRAIV